MTPSTTSAYCMMIWHVAQRACSNSSPWLPRSSVVTTPPAKVPAASGCPLLRPLLACARSMMRPTLFQAHHTPRPLIQLFGALLLTLPLPPTSSVGTTPTAPSPTVTSNLRVAYSTTKRRPNVSTSENVPSSPRRITPPLCSGNGRALLPLPELPPTSSEPKPYINAIIDTSPATTSLPASTIA